MKEHETVVLLKDISESDLRSGDIGAIVHVYADGKAYEVEFISGDGQTIAVLTLDHTDVRPLAKKEILHVRELARH
jgi:hypothetical protein